MYTRAREIARTGAVLFVTIVLLFAAGCTGSSPSHTTPRKEYDPQTTILIGSSGVNPPVLVVDKGVTVTWLDTDMEYHTVASDENDPDAFMSPPLFNNEEFQWTFTIPGTYKFHCTENPAIKGTIIVNP
ncbi:cupredoxin domain-containing protein [Methanoregula sp.]|jgi:plastocyanin|uniref:cupredoxin domain-containing protein n=1 Tax=Methanoregula sp. TaxID=2052170 RepID=UPI003567FF2D